MQQENFPIWIQQEKEQLHILTYIFKFLKYFEYKSDFYLYSTVLKFH